MKTLLLFPAFHEKFNRYPPLGIAYLAAVLRENALPVEVIDAAKYRSLQKFENELQDKRPDILGISVLSVHYDKALAAARIARKVVPRTVIVFGGAHPTMLPTQTLEHPEVDIVVSGEGELKFLNLVRSLQAGSDLGEVKGIFYKVGGKFVQTPGEEFCQDLDTIPYPAREAISMADYLRQAPTIPLPYPSTSIIASRGCHGNCRFCQPALRELFGSKIRYRSPQNVVNEIVLLKANYKVRGIFIADDEPTLDRNWMLEFCRELMHRQVRIVWNCGSRVDAVDRELLVSMKKAGCIQIGFGVESGSQKILNYYRKGIKVERIPATFELCRKAGIIARANIMIGAPDETRADAMETIELLERIRPDLIVTSVTTPTVGSDLFHDAGRRNLLKMSSLSGYDRFYVSTMKRALSDAEIIEFIRKALWAFRKGILKTIVNPAALWRRRYLFYHLMLHWLTMLRNPAMLLQDICYYLNYARKERIGEQVE